MKHYLFVGNSFTFVNDLPGMMKALFDPAALLYDFDSVLKGGAYLSQFADEKHEMGIKLREKLSAYAYDGIILQDQSFNPAKNFPEHLEAVKSLCALTGNAQLYMYQTWAYEDGSEKLKSTGMSYDGMKSALCEAYSASADAVRAKRVPVGTAFGYIHDSFPEIKLYAPDSYHPSPEGTYIAAVLFGAVLLGAKPEKVRVPDGVNENTAPVLREAAVSALASL